MQQRHQLRAVRPRRLHRLALAAPRPLVGRQPGDGEHVVARLRRQGAPAREPVAHPLRAGIVGGRRQPEIAELVGELAQELGRFRQRLHRVERIEQPALRRGARHELGDALGALAAARARADHAGLEPALLPDHPREEFERQVVRARRRLDHQAHGFAQIGIRGRPRAAAGGGAAFCSAGARRVSAVRRPAVRRYPTAARQQAAAPPVAPARRAPARSRAASAQ